MSRMSKYHEGRYCGGGNFLTYCAPKVRYAVGCDLSDELLALARGSAQQNRLANVGLCLGDSEATPFAHGSFSIATCRSAFHHMSHYQQVFEEMVRVVKHGGRICLQDMVAYEDPRVNEYFESLDKVIDVSHWRALSVTELLSLFHAGGIRIDDKVTAEQAFHLEAYIGDGYQSTEERSLIGELVEQGIKDDRLSKYFLYKDGDLHFKKSGMIIMGTIL